MTDTTVETALMGSVATMPESIPPGPSDDKPTLDEITAANQRYWYELINEKAAALFADLTDRTMQGFRYDGRGPPFVRISARCVKYRRIDLKSWIEARLRTSTSDTRPEDS